VPFGGEVPGMSTSVAALLAEKYGIDIKPGGKGECPFCRHTTFSIKRDDTIGKCFHPTCGRFVTQELQEHRFENGLHRVMEEIFQDFHAHLLALATITDHDNAYSYLVHERRIHPQVVADSMLGAVPSGYDCASKFDPIIAATKAAVKTKQGENNSEKQTTAQPTEHDPEFLIEAEHKFRNCTRGRAGWIAFFYADAHHRIVAIRFREPYSKKILYFKPCKEMTGLFGHGLFSQDHSQDSKPLDDYLIVTEGEFNQLQIQSLSLRYGEVTGQHTAYVFASSVGGVNSSDYVAIRKTSRHPVFCYDNDSDGAGLALVSKAQEMMSVNAFTTPNPDSDLDQFIRSFGNNYNAGWKAVKALVAGRALFPRIYSRTGKEFYRGKTFIPKRLADAIMEQHNFKYTASVLWVYDNGVYRSDGEPLVRNVAQALLGEERRENRIVETLRYIETATRVASPESDLAHINLRNGRLQWSTGNLEPHSSVIFEVIQLPVMFDPNAVCPQFDCYLETTLAPEIIPLVEEIMGYCLIPDTRFEKAAMLVGDGSNGKSVFLDTNTALQGKENVSAVALQDLEDNRFRVAELYGKLTNIFADLDERALNSSATFKALVTGDRITAERKFAQPFSFRPYARLIFSANSLPPSKDRTHAFYRRWLIIPFERTFEGNEADKELRTKLRNELPGILNRALRGLNRLFSEGKFTEPQAVKAALEDYQRDNDSVASFVTEFVEKDANATIAKQTLYGRYRNWCESQGLHPVTQKLFKASLKRIFPKLDEVRPSSGREPWHWVGIRLIEDGQSLADECNP
jgi:P4 family phage/plasmid primase-like protien